MTGVELIAAERRRQIKKEKFTAKHDADHHDSSLPLAAFAYAFHAVGETSWAKTWWPWDEEWYKPKDRRTDLIRAGALIAAELDRMEARP